MFSKNDIGNISNTLINELKKIYPYNEAASITKLLLEHLGYPNLELVTNKNRKLTEKQIEVLNQALKRLKNYEPIQYITGTAHFYGLILFVNPSVLIPRQETEELVDLVIKENRKAKPCILDIGTGCGCIALSLKKHIPGSKVDALDVHNNILEVAIKNAEILNLNVHFYRIDILHEGLLPGEYDIIVSNPPYVLEKEKSGMQKNVLSYEPFDALFVPDESPLIFYECIINRSAHHLNANGHIFLEINEKFRLEVKTLLAKAGFQEIRIIKDLRDKDRIATGKWLTKT